MHNWPAITQIGSVQSGRKLCLSNLNHKLREITVAAMQYGLQYMVFTDAFPETANISLWRDMLYRHSRHVDEIAERIRLEVSYVQTLKNLVSSFCATMIACSDVTHT